MGGNMARRLGRSGIELVVLDREAALAERVAGETRGRSARSLAELVAALPAPRNVWLMLPAGTPTEETIEALVPLLAPGDTIVDGANSYYRDSQRRARAVGERKLRFVDVGVSGGVWGEKNGYALMIGGDEDAVRPLDPVFRALAPSATTGWLHCGPSGAGHFVKMVHNGIEYGMMQAYAEGFSLMAHKKELELDLAAVAELWRHGSVVRSWLLDLIANFLKDGRSLEDAAPVVADSGEGRWTAAEGIDLGVPTPVIALALMARFGSQKKDDFASKMLARMRQAFGGHAVARAE
jgi:6-phosphogluconate dehydrogenase